MSTPEPAPAQPVGPAQPLPPPPDQLSAEEAVVALLAAWLAAQTTAAAAGIATRAALTPTRLVAAILALGIPRPAARAALRLALEAGLRVPEPPLGLGKAAQRAVARAEPIWRARYLLNAAKRIGKAIADPPRRPGQRAPRVPRTSPDLLLPGSIAPTGQQETSPAQWTPERMSPREAARHAFDAERRYLEQHREAQRRRQEAAAAVDAAAGRYGQVLGWYSVRDQRTTWDCLRMHGKNFHVSEPPAGTLPGSVHPRCRCTAGPPHPGARILGGSGV